MSIELTVILKDSERTYRQKFLIYDGVVMSPADDQIAQCISDARKNFEGEPEDIIVRTVMVCK